MSLCHSPTVQLHNFAEIIIYSDSTCCISGENSTLDTSSIPPVFCVNYTNYWWTGTGLFVWFDALGPSQQLWSCWDGQFTLNHSLSWASLNKQLTSTLCTYFRL